MNDNLFGVLRFAMRTPLQESVLSLGVCPHCHKKTMQDAATVDGFAFSQCTNCKTVQVSDANGHQEHP